MQPSLAIRDASVSDAEALIALDRAIIEDGRGIVLALDQLRDVETERRRIDDIYRAMSAGSATRSLVADVDGVVAGAADLRQLAPALCKHVALFSIGVHPLYQRRGIARALMNAVMEHARSAELERIELYVRADNERAHALYRSFGFTHEGTRARFVRLPDGRYVDDFIFALFIER